MKRIKIIILLILCVIIMTACSTTTALKNNTHYLNKSEDILTIDISPNTTYEYFITIYTSNGKEIFHQGYLSATSTNIFNINIHDLVSGIYTIKIEYNNNKETFQFTKV